MHTFDGNVNGEVLLAPATRGTTNSSYFQPFIADGADRCVVELNVGTTVQAISFKLTAATSSGGAGAADITGAALTSITTANDNTLNLIEIGPGALAALGENYTWVRAEMTIASAGTTPTAVTAWRHRLRRPGQAQDATVGQVVRVLG